MPENATVTGSLVLSRVTKHYGIAKDRQVTAADEVSLTVRAGEYVALTGASGSGKSTLLHLIGAIERPDSGTITASGVEVTALRGGPLAAYRRTVGFVFQRYHLLPALTALDNVIAPVLPYRTSWSKRDQGRELLEAVGLAGREQLLAELRGRSGMTIILATHDAQIAARCDRLVRLRDGAVVDDIDLDGGCP